MISILIADEEPQIREQVRAWLRNEGDIAVVAEAGHAMEAIRGIETFRPDLVFLDVRMPDFDGFQVLARAARTHVPRAVFMTAHESYALKAFDVQALDYLLKPLSETRFRQALARAKRCLSPADDPDERPEPANYLHRLTVKDVNRFLLLTTDQVDWIDSAANYVKLHVGKSAFSMRVTMNELERRLDPQHFARIHRSTIVNISRIKEVIPDWHGEFDVELNDGTKLRLTRTYRHRLLR